MADLAAPVRRSLTVVVNPTKVEELDAAKKVVADACALHGWESPRWIETTAEETGEKQGREAVESGADVVASLGGDGTVRAVASALVGTEVALGLLPGGTGNLLARNLDLPIDTLENAVEALLTGSERRIDVGYAAVGEQPEEVFLVMTGLGLDGEIMAGTSEKVKAAVGWGAYVLAAAGKVFSRGFSVTVEGGSEIPLRRHARTVVIGNCGTLQGGIELLPDAQLDDGLLDGVIIAPKGALGWGSVLVDVATRHRAGHRRLDRLKGARLRIRAAEAVEVEIDGDPIGEHRELSVRVEPRSLVVRVG
ncbi:diacylglycerol kinase [Intrasporangium oryzae NRRL B-24470]|uniref:Diacylglycerol kinase n=1 Tax=Intrasporangium oryzae NRRL B-24470 TaxID=1386089 RepID=W9GAM3_9MICO|nr:diacylglycerol kinase family protein [Intrasporangium oryzae]EWT03236.1 diacylglycerol kinase [Intrasporangium oryzae NRRL B-24470]